MACGNKNYVKRALVFGIVFLVLDIIHGASAMLRSNAEWHSINMSKTQIIVSAVLGALFNGILVFGAKQRNSTAILIWIVLAIMRVIYFAVADILVIIAISGNINGYDDYGYPTYDSGLATVAFSIAFAFTIHLFLYIRAFVVAIYARREIQNGGITEQGVVYNQMDPTPQQSQLINTFPTQPPHGMQLAPPQGMQVAPPPGMQVAPPQGIPQQGIQMAWNGKEWVPVTYQA